MLKNLVKKFKSQSLNEDAPDQHETRRNSSTTLVGPNQTLKNSSACSTFNATQFFRHRCCPHKEVSCPHHGRYQGPTSGLVGGGDPFDERDSGTESDEELDFIETNSTHSVPVSQTSDYYASQQSLSINSCRSSHCGSPLLGLSDQECNSWESIGSESGINLRATAIKRQHRREANSSSTHTPFGLNYEFLLNPYKSTRADASATPTMIAEELPNHHYHTRQQFQRLKQQISMKNGDDLHHDDDQSKLMATAFSNFPTKISTDSTAFSPFSRFVAPALPAASATNTGDKSPSDSSLADELEEINSNDDCGRDYSWNNDKRHNASSRRSRSSTLSTASIISSSGVSTGSCSSSASSSGAAGGRGNWSEKRKWSQMRQQHKTEKSTCAGTDCCCSCAECGNDAQPKRQMEQQQRAVLHAARKTPVKLIYPLSDETIGQQRKGPIVDTADCAGNRKMNSPMDDSMVRKTRFSARKKCRSDDDAKSMDCGETEERESQDGFEKRPSLDFNKMRAKRVGGSGKIAKKPKRSRSLNGSSMKSKLTGNQYSGYHLRSARRRQCLFRPLDPATIIGGPVPGVHGAGNLNAESASWFMQRPLDSMNNCD